MIDDAVPMSPRPDPTGVPDVDDVVDSVDRLVDRPLAEHAEVFEQAHQRLRRALDDTGDAGEPGR